MIRRQTRNIQPEMDTRLRSFQPQSIRQADLLHDHGDLMIAVRAFSQDVQRKIYFSIRIDCYQQGSTSLKQYTIIYNKLHLQILSTFCKIIKCLKWIICIKRMDSDKKISFFPANFFIRLDIQDRLPHNNLINTPTGYRRLL